MNGGAGTRPAMHGGGLRVLGRWLDAEARGGYGAAVQVVMAKGGRRRGWSMLVLAALFIRPPPGPLVAAPSIIRSSP
jgi:hypothetical protein